jgi:hypothetical protein
MKSNYQDNARSHMAKVAMDALNEIGGTPIEHLPYSPDLTPCNFWLFKPLKGSFKARNSLFHYTSEACDKWSAACF